MAEAKKKPGTVKKPESVRERAGKSAEPKHRRIRRVSNSASKPLKAVSKLGQREYYLPLPNNKIGKFLNKRRSIMPAFIKNSWAEVRQVNWPNRRETFKLTTAVIIFALVFGGLIWVVDYGLEKLFRQIIL